VALLVAATPRSSSSSSSGSAKAKAQAAAAASARVECRSCAFSPDGQTVYTVQVRALRYSGRYRYNVVCVSV
jgi:hypothetical protein